MSGLLGLLGDRYWRLVARDRPTLGRRGSFTDPKRVTRHGHVARRHPIGKATEIVPSDRSRVSRGPNAPVRRERDVFTMAAGSPGASCRRTNLGGIPSNLVATMNADVGAGNWLQPLEDAFAQWENVANVNFSQVSDNGSALGAASFSREAP